MQNEIDVIQTSLLRALASPHRLRVIHLLGERPREVHELADELGLAQATVSQHLGAMRAVGLVEAVRDGRSVRYGLADPQILAACSLMREVIVRRLSALGSIAAAARRIDLRGTAPEATTSRPTAGPAGSQVTHR
ncbi:MAG: metalloregulator ArsR/SmtB family transcription factor [Chloroflexota bacterium]